MQTSRQTIALHLVPSRMECNKLLVLHKLVNGVLTGEERLDVLRWSAQFANRCMTNHTQHLISRNRTEKCSVCAFVSRCGVIGASLGNSVHMLDITLHKMAVHLPVNWTIICILGGLLLYSYTSSIDADCDACFLQPGDLVHHYMITSECLYAQDGPMVAIRHACSQLNENIHISRERGRGNNVVGEDGDCLEMEISDTEGGEPEGLRRVPSTHANGAKLIGCIVSMINRSDVSGGQCEDMAYTVTGCKARTGAMYIPASVMLTGCLSDPSKEQHVRNTNIESADIERLDNLYAIYPDLMANSQVGDTVSSDGMLIQDEASGGSSHKVRALMLGSYEWMNSLAGCCSAIAR